jgi:hypothetical protein
MDSVHDQLHTAWAAFLDTPFPAGSADPELSELHRRLAVFDTETAGIVSKVLQGGTTPPSWLEPDLELSAAANQLIAAGNDAARAYKERIDELNDLLSLVRRCASH